jgi:hypothetical protein
VGRGGGTALGYGGVTLVAEATGISRSTIVRGSGRAEPGGRAWTRVRCGGKCATAVDPHLERARWP